MTAESNLRAPISRVLEPESNRFAEYRSASPSPNPVEPGTVGAYATDRERPARQRPAGSTGTIPSDWLERTLGAGLELGARTDAREGQPDVLGICRDEGSGEGPIGQAGVPCNFLLGAMAALVNIEAGNVLVEIGIPFPASFSQDDQGIGRKSRSDLLGDVAQKPSLRFAQGNLRKNLARLTGRKPKGAEAHHVLHVEFETQFQRRGINIHDPKYGAWWAWREHRKNAWAYNRKWETFLRDGPSPEAIIQYGRSIARKYGLEIHF